MNDTLYSERKKYVEAFNDTMIKIWQEQITLLGVIDTHSLLRSPTALPVRTDGRFFEVGLSQAFSNTDYGRTTAQDEKYHASRERCQIHLNTAEAKLVLGKAKFREETVATSDTKRSEVAAVGFRVSITPP